MIRVKRNDVMSYECQELQNAANDVDLTLEERDEAAEQLERYFSAIEADAPLDKWTASDFAGREHEIN